VVRVGLLADWLNGRLTAQKASTCRSVSMSDVTRGAACACRIVARVVRCKGDMCMQVKRDTEAAEKECRQLQLRASLLANELSNLNDMLQQRGLPIITYKYQPVQGSNRVRRTSSGARKPLHSVHSRPSLGAASMGTADSYSKAARAVDDDAAAECRDVATSTSLLTSPIHGVKDLQGTEIPVSDMLNHAISSLNAPMEQAQVCDAKTQISGLPVQLYWCHLEHLFLFLD
jgi:hypothetical protein